MAAYDPQGALRVNPSFNDAVAITASNTTVLNDVQALVVGVAGNVNVVTAKAAALAHVSGTAPTPVLIAMAAGIPLPLAVSQVLATSTTATGIVGLIGSDPSGQA